jgi:hypothetical protein
VTGTEIVGTALFGMWFALTVIVQMPWKRCKLPRRFEPTGHLLPGWHFFSPKPVIADLEVLYRYTRKNAVDGEATEWKEIFPYTGRPVQYLFYNPHRRARKVLFQCAQRILQTSGGHPERSFLLSLSIPYLLLLDRVTAMCPDADAVQFRIDVVRHGPHPCLTAFCSPMHAVADDEDEVSRYVAAS